MSKKLDADHKRNDQDSGRKGGLSQSGGPGSDDKRRNQDKDGQLQQGRDADEEGSQRKTPVGAPTSYDDPTNAVDPPGGKHHDTDNAAAELRTNGKKKSGSGRS